jgi:arylformamidase
MRALYREFDSQAQIDAQYNPSLGLEPGDQPMLHFAARAAHTRTALRCILNVPYGPTLEETLDIFPAEVPNAPVFVFIHGGYWRALSSKDFSGVALGLHPLGNHHRCHQLCAVPVCHHRRDHPPDTRRHGVGSAPY